MVNAFPPDSPTTRAAAGGTWMKIDTTWRSSMAAACCPTPHKLYNSPLLLDYFAFRHPGHAIKIWWQAIEALVSWWIS